MLWASYLVTLSAADKIALLSFALYNYKDSVLKKCALNVYYYFIIIFNKMC